jgi:hypothetical protein
MSTVANAVISDHSTDHYSNILVTDSSLLDIIHYAESQSKALGSLLAYFQSFSYSNQINQEFAKHSVDLLRHVSLIL